MKEVYVFFEKDDIKGVFDNFIKFRKNTFHYILGFLVKNGDFKSKLEGVKNSLQMIWVKNLLKKTKKTQKQRNMSLPSQK